jgi:hypothetical protein
MRSGTKLVLVFAVAALGSYVVLRLYGERITERFAATPLSAAREFVMADNTVVGTMGGIREVALVEVAPIDARGDTVGLIAEVVGRAGGGMLFADLAREARAWRVLRASFLTPEGNRLPLADGRPALDRAP